MSKDLNASSPEDYVAWVQHPMTVQFLEGLLEDRMRIMELWSKRHFVGDNADQTNFLNAKALAQIDTIDQIVDNISNSAEDARRLIKERQHG